ncbi:MAG: hypothetical protein P8Z49_08190 [Acidobacteriota bacterium]
MFRIGTFFGKEQDHVRVFSENLFNAESRVRNGRALGYVDSRGLPDKRADKGFPSRGYQRPNAHGKEYRRLVQAFYPFPYCLAPGPELFHQHSRFALPREEHPQAPDQFEDVIEIPAVIDENRHSQAFQSLNQFFARGGLGGEHQVRPQRDDTLDIRIEIRADLPDLQGSARTIAPAGSTDEALTPVQCEHRFGEAGSK